MIRMKNDQIKLYKDSFIKASAKSRSPSKYQSSDNIVNNPSLNPQSMNQQALIHSNSSGNLSQNHKRSQSHNMTASNIKPQSSYEGQQQKNLIQ